MYTVYTLEHGYGSTCMCCIQHRSMMQWTLQEWLICTQRVVDRGLWRAISVKSKKKMHAALCFDAVFFQCCVQLFKICAHFSKVACNFSKVNFQKLRALLKSCAQLSKVACNFSKVNFQKLRALFKSCVHFSKVACNFSKVNF